MTGSPPSSPHGLASSQLSFLEINWVKRTKIVFETIFQMETVPNDIHAWLFVSVCLLSSNGVVQFVDVSLQPPSLTSPPPPIFLPGIIHHNPNFSCIFVPILYIHSHCRHPDDHVQVFGTNP